MKKRSLILIAAGIAASVCLWSCSEDTPEPQVQPEQPGQPSQPELPGVPSNLPTIESITLTPAESNAMKQFGDFALRLNDAALSLGTDVFGSANGNYSLSPVSATICLALYANSIDEPQRSATVKALGFDRIEDLNALVTKLLQFLPSPTNGAVTQITNAVWYSDSFSVTDSYTKLMADNFGATVAPLDMLSPAALATVNDWCKTNTLGMIPAILERIDPETTAMWLNAVYFAGTWMSKFDKEKTSRETFHGSNGDTTVDMMHNTIGGVYYSKADDLEKITLSFEGWNYEAELILGGDANASLTAEELSTLRSKDRTVKAELTLPRFKLASNANLTPVLESLGLVSTGSTFTAMGLPAVEKLIRFESKQKTAMSIDEEGAKVAAVTYEGIATSPGPEPEPDFVKFTVDRPFRFMVRNTVTGAIILMGRVCNLPDAQ